VISFLARNELPEYYLLLAGHYSLGEYVCLGFDGLYPAVKTRVTMMAPQVCAGVATSAHAAELFLLA
jgi:hypothetical protein